MELVFSEKDNALLEGDNGTAAAQGHHLENRVSFLDQVAYVIACKRNIANDSLREVGMGCMRVLSGVAW